jgi:hypothetical protein
MTRSVKMALKAAHTIRRDNLLCLVGEGRRFVNQAALASALKVTEGYLTHLVGAKPRRRITETTARKFEFRLGIPTGSLDDTE